MKNPYLRLIRLSWKYAGKERLIFLFIYASYIIGNLITSSLPLFYGWFINNLQRDGVDALKYAWIYVLLYIGLNLLKWCFYGPARVREQALAFNIGRNFMMETYHQVLSLDMQWHQENHSGSVISRIRKSHDALRGFFQTGFVYFHAIIRFTFSSFAILYFSSFYGSIGIVLGIIAIWITLKFDKPLMRHFKETNEKEHVVSSTLFDSLSNITTVLTLRLERQMERTLLDKIQKGFASFRKGALLGEWKWFAADILVVFIYGIITLGYVAQHWQSGVPFYVGGLVTLLAYVTQFTGVFYEFAWQYNQVLKYNADVKEVDQLKQDYELLHKDDSDEILPGDWRVIEIKNMNFNYSDSGRNKEFRLHCANIFLKRGKRIAIIGDSGGGKSTILNLLRGLYQLDQKPDILVDGNKFHSMQIINKNVALFPQEPEIFESSIRYNISLGLQIDDDQIMWACEMSNFKEVIQKLPEGIDAMITEKGVNLSGGQKQRLALARGILAARSSPIILMDEPTSSVDPQNELEIYRKLFKEFSDKAIVSSLHRMYLLPLFDYFYVVQNGFIAVEGTFEYLEKNSELFRRHLNLMEKVAL